MASRRFTLGAGMAALALAAGGVGLPFYSSRTLEADLKALSAQGGAGRDYMLRNLKHEAGIFSSKGAVDLELRSRCSVDEDEPFVVRVDYTVSHLPGLSGLNGFSWVAAPQGEAGEEFAKLFGAGGKLSGKGAVTYGGTITSGMELPEISATNDGTVLQVPPSRGMLV